MITYQVERFPEFAEEFASLVVEHYFEIARNRDIVPLDPDYDKYLKLDSLDMLSCATARSDGKLIGYCINFVNTHIHYKSTVWSVNDLLFITKRHRGRMAGLLLVKEAVKDLKRRGVTIASFHAKSVHDIGPLIKRLGGEEAERIHELRLV